MLRLAFIALCVLLSSVNLARAAPSSAKGGRAQTKVPAVQEGDLIFQRSRSRQSAAILAATKSPLTHVGVVVKHQGKLMVFEASKTARFTSLKRFIARGKNGKYLHARPNLSDEQRKELKAVSARYVGRPYDIHFAPGDKKLYCTELTDLVLKGVGVELGQFTTVGALALEHRAVKVLIEKRLGAHPACKKLTREACLKKISELPIITPRDQAKSPALTILEDQFSL